MGHVASHPQGLWLVEGKRTYVFHLRDGRRVTMEAIVFSLKYHWRFLTSEPLEIHAFSWDLNLEAA